MGLKTRLRGVAKTLSRTVGYFSIYDIPAGNGLLAFACAGPLVLRLTNLHEHSASPVRLGP
jgi:hypothetical protein